MVESSFIKDIVIFAGANIVLVIMDSGSYLYVGVPNEIAAMFLIAESKGAFFNKYIKNVFTYQRVG